MTRTTASLRKVWTVYHLVGEGLCWVSVQRQRDEREDHQSLVGGSVGSTLCPPAVNGGELGGEIGTISSEHTPATLCFKLECRCARWVIQVDPGAMEQDQGVAELQVRTFLVIDSLGCCIARDSLRQGWHIGFT